MVAPLLLDTHALIWLSQDSRKLGKKTRKLLEQALHHSPVYLSAISLWECGLREAKEQRGASISTDQMLADLPSLGIQDVAVTSPIAILASQLRGLHFDPADRIICASAILHNAVLVTADSVILDWPNPLKRWDAST